MQIKEITGGSVTLQIEVGTCLALASACHLAATSAGDDEYPIHDAIFTALWAAFEAFALVGAAPCHMSPGNHADYTVERVKAEWGTLPLILNGKEVAK